MGAMTRAVLYVAHPISPGDGETIGENLQRAMRWFAWLRAAFPQDTFIAPWIATVMSLHGDDSPDLREAGLRDDCAVVERCDGIVLCGPRVSSGMQREADHGREHSHVGFSVYDMTRGALVDPPAAGTGFDGPCPWTIEEWYFVRDKMRWSEVTR
jgi:hypothetical protein